MGDTNNQQTPVTYKNDFFFGQGADMNTVINSENSLISILVNFILNSFTIRNEYEITSETPDVSFGECCTEVLQDEKLLKMCNYKYDVYMRLCYSVINIILESYTNMSNYKTPSGFIQKDDNETVNVKAAFAIRTFPVNYKHAIECLPLLRASLRDWCEEKIKDKEEEKGE